MPRYCQRCVLPETRPGVVLDASSVCRGCRNAEHKAQIDWQGRAAAFDQLVVRSKQKAESWDCVIPVSGGKDSYWQVVTCLERGLRPLCVTYVVPGRTALGEANLRRLVQIGVDHLELRLDPKVERALVKKTFLRTGISGLVSHMAIYAWPIQLAARLSIPLVVYGENSAFEYGGEDESLMGARVDKRWIERFGVTAGTTAVDWVDENLTAQKLAPLFQPSEAAVAAIDLRAVFLGHYFAWDPEHSRAIALAHGFQARAEGARVGHYDYVNIDDDMIGVHHHPKWHKFGITRTFDTLSMEIRNGRLSRAQAIAEIRARGDETPWADIELFCSYLGLSRREYFATLERFRNRQIWARKDGRWVIDRFLLDDFSWPADPELGT